MLLQVLSLYGLLSQVTGTYGLPSQNGTLCRSMPGDMGWPAPATWNQLNTTVGGRLLAAVPVADVCHGATYSETACSALKQDWDLAGLMYVCALNWYGRQYTEHIVPFTVLLNPQISCLHGSRTSLASRSPTCQPPVNWATTLLT